MSIKHLLHDRATIKRPSRQFVDGQWQTDEDAVHAECVPCRMQLGVRGAQQAIAGAEHLAHDATVYFDRCADILENDIVTIRPIEELEVLRVIEGGEAPYRAALCRVRR